MISRWDETAAAACPDALALRVYSARLLGQDPELVLCGGGNTSVKLTRPDIFGEPEPLLLVKGSGWDLATIDAAGFAPVRLERLRRLVTLPAMTDVQMAQELRAATIDPAAPAPSVEAILHAILPGTFVDHTHADAFIALGNTPDGEAHVRACYGPQLLVVPYVMPGFELARAVYQQLPQITAQTIGVALMGHGIFCWGDDARTSYQRMIDLVTAAERYLIERDAWAISAAAPTPSEPPDRVSLAGLRRRVSAAAGFPMIMTTHSTPQTLAFAQLPDLAQIAGQGPATPDHVIRTKRVPQIGRDVDQYAAEYRQYVQSYADGSVQPIDPAPRVILDPQFGMAALGRSAAEAATAAEVYRHTIEIIMRAERLGGWRALPPEAIFRVEYWDLEQAKLKRAGPPPALAGEVALVTGAASGIGKACAERLLARGAAVIALDINPAVAATFLQPGALGICCDLTDEAAVSAALEAGVLAFGGLDVLVLNAGIFPASRRLERLPLAEWDRTLQVNVGANVTLLRECHPLLRLAPNGGRVVVIGSKNVPAPGPGAAAYSASKAALTQVARVAALEWGQDNIRVNVIHPNAVFDTGIWSEEVLRARAESYNLTVDEYRTNNLLRAPITSQDVAALAVELCGPAFSRTTGAQIPVDGGNERVI